MSHGILVISDQVVSPSQLRSLVPGLEWSGLSEEFRPFVDYGMASQGAARGAVIQHRPADGTDDTPASYLVRLMTGSSAEDVGLAIDVVQALMGLDGTHAINEDDVEFASSEELREHYDDDFVERYVAWGPEAIANQVADHDEDTSITLMGPYASVAVSKRQIAAWKAGDQLATQMLALLRRRHLQAREIRAHLLAKDVTALATDLASPETKACLWSVIDTLLSQEPLARSVSVLSGIGPIEPLLSPDSARSLLTVDRYQAPELAMPILRVAWDIACECARADTEYARAIAEGAFMLAQQGQFEEALAIFDFVVELPSLDTPDGLVASTATPSGGERGGPRLQSFSVQASWACNALWAVQHDNNGLPLNETRARRYLEKCVGYGPSNPAIFFNAACVCYELGNHEEVFAHIRAAVRHDYDHIEDMRREPLFLALHDDPRFQQAFDA